MKKSFIYGVFLIVLLLSSCFQSRTTETEISEKARLFLADSMSIPIPEDVSYRAYMSQVVQSNDTMFLLRENWIKKAIDVIDLKNREYLRSIHIPSDGPNSFSFYSFLFHNTDTIFCFPFRGLETFVFDFKGNFKFKKEIPIKFKYSEPQEIMPTNQDPATFENSILSVTSTSYIHYGHEPDKFHGDNFSMNYILNEDSSWIPKVYFPGSYFGNIYPILRIYRTYSYYAKQFINSFSYSHYLYISDYFGLVDSVLVQSKYMDEIPSFTKYEEANRGRDCFTENMYADIIYDKYNNVYYRFVALVGDEQFLNKVNIANQYLYRPFVIMLLDAEFNILDEMEMPSGQYNYYDYFVNERGLWISTNNPENELFNENFLRYQLVKFNKS